MQFSTQLNNDCLPYNTLAMIYAPSTHAPCVCVATHPCAIRRPQTQCCVIDALGCHVLPIYVLYVVHRQRNGLEPCCFQLGSYLSRVTHNNCNLRMTTHDTRHTTHDTRHMTHDTRYLVH